MKRDISNKTPRRLILAALLLLASLLWLSLSACQNSPARAHERRVEPPPTAEQSAPATQKASDKSALDRMDSFFNKPLGVELIKE